MLQSLKELGKDGFCEIINIKAVLHLNENSWHRIVMRRKRLKFTKSNIVLQLSA